MSTPVLEAPFAGLDTDEAEQAGYVAGSAVGSLTPFAVAAGLGGAFYVYREYMRRRLEKRINAIQSTDPEQIRRESQQIFVEFRPVWISMAGPLLLRGYLNGVEETDFLLSVPFLSDLADNYAYSLANHINDVSSEAIVRGYIAQVNRNIPTKVALANVIDAFGVPPRTMKSLVNIWTTKEEPKLSENLMPSVKKLRAKQVALASIKQRADTIGDQESWNAKQQGKQVLWLYAMKQGLIPDTATRTWITADDERVCPHCGPMHKVELSITEPFEVPISGGTGKFWAPPVHPRCRCEVKLNANIGRFIVNEAAFSGFQRKWMDAPEPEVVAKIAKADDDWEPKEHPRSQRSGRFIRANQTDSRPFADPTEVREDDGVDALLRGIDDVLLNDVQVAPPTLGRNPNEKKSTKGTLGRNPNESGKSLGRAKEQPTLGRANTEGSLSRGSLSRGSLQRGSLQRGALNEDARNIGRAEARNRFATNLVPGEVVPDNKPKERGQYHKLESPLYALVDQNLPGAKQRSSVVHHNDRFDINNTEMVADPADLMSVIRERNAITNREFLQELDEREGGRELTFNDKTQEYYLDDDVVTQVLNWERNRQQSGRAFPDEDKMVSVPLLNYNKTDGVDPDDDAYENYGEDDLLEAGYLERGPSNSTRQISIGLLSEKLGAADWVERHQVRLVKVDTVHPEWSDIGSSMEQKDHGLVTGQYKMRGQAQDYLNINGSWHYVWETDPDWVDE